MFMKLILNRIFNFIYSISNNSAKSNEYAHIIKDNLSIENFNFTEGTSPHKVTEPIAAQGNKHIINGNLYYKFLARKT